jgi:hypothetical protein
MRQLHTIHLDHIILSRMYLRTILSSPYLIHLILDTVQMPKISKFPPTKLRKLTLMMKSSWEAVQPLISQLATSLEYLELRECEFLSRSQLQLPPFPCLQELRNHQRYFRRTFYDTSQLNELLRLGSQVTHLHVTGHFDYEPVTACRESLQHLSTIDWMLTERIFGMDPFPRLTHLSLRLFPFSDMRNRQTIRASFIRDHFPRITSFHLHMPWLLRNCAMGLARSQHNVHTVKLVIDTKYGIGYTGSGEIHSFYPVEVSNDLLHQARLPSALRTLMLEVIHARNDLERCAAECTRWLYDDIIPSVPGLGGPDLKSIDILVIQPKSESVERERVLSRRLVKVSNDDWQMVE